MLGFDERGAVTGSDDEYYVPKLEVSYDRQLMLVSATSCGSGLTGTTDVDVVDYDEFHALYLELALEPDEHEFDWCFLNVIPATPISQATSIFASGSTNSSSTKEFRNGSRDQNSEREHIATGTVQPVETESGSVTNGVDHHSPASEIDPRFSIPSPADSDPESPARLNGSVPPRASALDDKSLLLTPSASPHHRIPVSVPPAPEALQEPAVDEMVGKRLQHDGKWMLTARALGQNKSKAMYDTNNKKTRCKRISFNKQADAYPLLLDGDRLDDFLSLEYPSHIEVDKWAPLVVRQDSGPSYPNYCKLFGDVFRSSPLDKRCKEHIAAVSRYYVIDMSDVDDYFTDEDLQGRTTDHKPTSLDRSVMDFTLSYLFPDGKKRLDILVSPIPYFVVRSNNKGSHIGRTGQPLAEVPKRPLNVHRLFATAALHQVMRNSASADARMVNTAKVQSAIAMIWRRLPPKLKSLFMLLQQESAALHSSLFPDYKYCPHRNKPKRKAEAIDNEE
ncbi:hypothetical protein V1525DRAFT_396396 [Lipomyces kononenkoae]|uniref:Uncharacterized protein n=1 Tax=Lipomyces kononenkoae TaxID=34357 RepID=A0ACC3T8A6_LIPKO